MHRTIYGVRSSGSVFIHYICTNKSTSGNRTTRTHTPSTVKTFSLFSRRQSWMHFDYRPRALTHPHTTITVVKQRLHPLFGRLVCACPWISAYHFATLAIALCKLIDEIECHWQRYRLSLTVSRPFQFGVCVCVCLCASTIKAKKTAAATTQVEVLVIVGYVVLLTFARRGKP